MEKPSFFMMSEQQKASNLFAWAFGFSFAFILVVALVFWLLKRDKQEKFTYIKIGEPKTDKQPARIQPQDLSRIDGIGPKINAVLHQAGILTYSQLAKTDVSTIQQMLDEAGLSRFNPESWPEQAAGFASDE
jgi:hypothetical protein